MEKAELAELGHIECKHNAAFPMYFLNYALKPPPLTSGGGQLPPGAAEPMSAAAACTTPSASCADGQIREWVQRQLLLEGQQHWVQSRGRDTFDIEDDAFDLA